MINLPVIAVFDIGRTNKKCFLFDEQYTIVWEQSVELAETADEDGFPCEDVHALTAWVKQTMQQVWQLEGFSVQAVNFSAHGASFVYINEAGEPVGHLYNYLKPYPAALQQKFYNKYGGEKAFRWLLLHQCWAASTRVCRCIDSKKKNRSCMHRFTMHYTCRNISVT